jgi:hypothetical protein
MHNMQPRSRIVSVGIQVSINTIAEPSWRETLRFHFRLRHYPSNALQVAIVSDNPCLLSYVFAFGRAFSQPRRSLKPAWKRLSLQKPWRAWVQRHIIRRLACICPSTGLTQTSSVHGLFVQWDSGRRLVKALRPVKVNEIKRTYDEHGQIA